MCALIKRPVYSRTVMRTVVISDNAVKDTVRLR